MPFLTWGEVKRMNSRRSDGKLNGLGDAASDFSRWSSILDQYTDIIPHIPHGATRESLAHQANVLYPQQQSLKEAFQGQAGVREIARAATFGSQVKKFRDAVNKGRDTWGTVNESYPVMLLKNQKKGGIAKAGFGFKWWYLLFLLPFAKKLK